MSHRNNPPKRLTKSNLIIHTENTGKQPRRDVPEWVSHIPDELRHNEQNHGFSGDIEMDMEQIDLEVDSVVAGARSNAASPAEQNATEKNSAGHQLQQPAMNYENAMESDTYEGGDTANINTPVARMTLAGDQHPAVNGGAQSNYAQATLAGMGAQFSAGDNRQNAQ
ncbi:hypothetical protein FE257_000508 [Aspergillus nanangensis]|uniref:Uncharacterized protein n=1 Tax=Aspergillus nanangensis TaxID=2582783 RepID=A0AAD4GXI3_ASPNN|nr:hypothetical protein FE257_000508 [Aspergillus nanangensis]